MLPKAHREDKLSSLAVAGIFVGMDKVAVEGTRIAVLDKEYMKTTDPITEVIVCTTVRTKDDSFPLLDAVKPSDADLEEFVKSVLPVEPVEAATPPPAQEEKAAPGNLPQPEVAGPGGGETPKLAEQAEVNGAFDDIFNVRERGGGRRQPSSRPRHRNAGSRTDR